MKKPRLKASSKTTKLIEKALPTQEPSPQLLSRIESRLESATVAAQAELDQLEQKSLSKGQLLSRSTWAAIVVTSGGLGLLILRRTPLKRFLGPLKPNN